MLLSKLSAILSEYLDLTLFLVSDIQQFWNCKYAYIYTNKYFRAMINSALCILLIQLLRKLKGSQLHGFQDNLESSHFVFTNQLSVTCYFFFLGGKWHKLLTSKPGNINFTGFFFIYLQSENVFTYFGNISFMDVPYKTEGYLETILLDSWKAL